MTWWLRVRIRLDRVLAVGLLILLGPLVLAMAVVIRWHDGGPAFVRLRRSGRNGAGFHVWKLRTMTIGRDSVRAAGSALSTADDQRITRVGVPLRRFRLDELPQLLNVIKGEMSLFGPRPEDPAFVDLADKRWRNVLCQPPGIAGLTQVLVHDWEAVALSDGEREPAYRKRVLPVKLAVDEWYVANATPLIDLLVVLALIERFGGGRRDTVAHRRVLPLVPSPAATILSTPSTNPRPFGPRDSQGE